MRFENEACNWSALSQSNDFKRSAQHTYENSRVVANKLTELVEQTRVPPMYIRSIGFERRLEAGCHPG